MMQQEDLTSMIITIAGRPFPVKVDDQEVVLVKDLETEVNAKIMEFQKTYPTRDKLDAVIMTLLTYTFDLRKKPWLPDEDIVSKKMESIIDVLNSSDFD